MREYLIFIILAISVDALAQQYPKSFILNSSLRVNVGGHKFYSIGINEKELGFLRFQKPGYLRFINPLEQPAKSQTSFTSYTKSTFTSIPSHLFAKSGTRLPISTYQYTQPNPFSQAFLNTLDFAARMFLENR